MNPERLVKWEHDSKVRGLLPKLASSTLTTRKKTLGPREICRVVNFKDAGLVEVHVNWPNPIRYSCSYSNAYRHWNHMICDWYLQPPRYYKRFAPLWRLVSCPSGAALPSEFLPALFLSPRTFSAMNDTQKCEFEQLSPVWLPGKQRKMYPSPTRKLVFPIWQSPNRLIFRATKSEGSLPRSKPLSTSPTGDDILLHDSCRYLLSI